MFHRSFIYPCIFPLVCAVTTWMVHTRLLKNKVFNSVNSNKREELTDAEELELADTKAREKKMVSILEGKCLLKLVFHNNVKLC